MYNLIIGRGESHNRGDRVWRQSLQRNVQISAMWCEEATPNRSSHVRPVAALTAHYFTRDYDSKTVNTVSRSVHMFRYSIFF